MKTRRIPMIIKPWLVLFLVLALLPCVAMAKDTAAFDKQLIEAAKSGDRSLVAALLVKGADVNGKSAPGRTALMEAAEAGHLEVVKLLLDKGADVNIRSFGGFTALMLAAEEGNPKVVESLIAKGADVSSTVPDVWCQKRQFGSGETSSGERR